jgi:hypothetical protein
MVAEIEYPIELQRHPIVVFAHFKCALSQPIACETAGVRDRRRRHSVRLVPCRAVFLALSISPMASSAEWLPVAWRGVRRSSLIYTIATGSSCKLPEIVRGVHIRPYFISNAYNFAHSLGALKRLTPYEFICKCWTNQPKRFNLNPIHQMPGLNS